MPSKWADILGVLWVPSAIPSHFFTVIAFQSGVLSAQSSILEPRNPGALGLPKCLAFQAPGFPSSLIIGEAAIDLLDRKWSGLVKEVAVQDPFGRPCVEALCALTDIFTDGTVFASPIFNSTQEALAALETRKTT